MTISELKLDIIKRISSIEDIRLLEKIKEFLEIGSKKDGV